MIVTHRLSMLDLVDRLVIMDSGKIVADGPKDAVLRALKDEQVRSASTARGGRPVQPVQSAQSAQQQAAQQLIQPGPAAG